MSNLLLILSFPCADAVRALAGLERCLDLFEEEQSDPFPVHWNFPAHPLLADSTSRAEQVVGRLKKRNGDLLLPMGFAGAPHALLYPDELAQELAWIDHNSFGSDFPTVTGSTPSFLFPASADLARPSSLELYRQSRPLLLAARSEARAVVWSRGEGAAFPLLQLPAAHAVPSTVPGESSRLASSLPAALRAFERSASESAGFILIDVTGLSGEELSATFGALLRLRRGDGGRRFIRLDELSVRPEQHAALHPFALLAGIPVDPSSRHLRLEASVDREGRGSGGRRRTAGDRPREGRARDRLVAFAHTSAREPSALVFPLPPEEPDDRVLLADMQGEVSLAEGTLVARFNGGRLCGLARAGQDLLAGSPGGAFATIAGQRLEFQIEGAFSFEGSDTRGLQVVQNLREGPFRQPWRVVTDFAFFEGLAQLVVTVTVSYPEFDADAVIDDYGFLELSLASGAVDSATTLVGWYPDGERYSLPIPPADGSFLAAGARFVVNARDAALLVAWSGAEPTSIELLPLRIRRDERGAQMRFNPGGSYEPVAGDRLSGITERFTLLLDTGPRDAVALPALVDAVNMQRHPFWITRRTAASPT